MQEINFKLGSDPELMLCDTQTKELRSAIPIIAEGKGAGRPLDATGENCVLHDNVLIEFNTKPADTRDEFVSTIGSVLKSISGIVAESGLELRLQASATFPPQELADEEARLFGCDPDFDAYALALQEVAAEAAEQPFRSAGGHLHIGMSESDEAVCELLGDDLGKVRVVKSLDVFVGMLSVFIDKDATAPERRKLYGRAGSHRPKTYGVEYRACGPWWLGSPRHTELVHRLSEAAVSFALDELELKNLIIALGGEERVQELVNDSLADECRAGYDNHIRELLDDETNELIEALVAENDNEFRLAWKL